MRLPLAEILQVGFTANLVGRLTVPSGFKSFEAVSSQTSMRFLLYNIRYATGIGRRFHLPVPYSGLFKPTNGNLAEIVDFIKLIGPDIVGLLEVDCGSYRCGKTNQAETIATEIGHHSVYQNKYCSDSLAQKVPVVNKQGNAFLTNQPIETSRFHYFREGIKRLVIELELERCTLFLVHLSLKFRHRQYQLQDLHSMVMMARKPVILAGDFNVFWGDRELELFLAATGLKNANGDGQPSHPSRAPRRQLDFIFHSPDIRTSRFHIPHVKLSDHAPLVCDFDMNN
jgi:endonuclease/exonuclease/phosphatase family metal-dependent hydrolase